MVLSLVVGGLLALALVHGVACHKKRTPAGPEGEGPRVVSAVSTDDEHVRITFSVAVDQTSAEETDNYAITTEETSEMLGVLGAALDDDDIHLVLTTEEQDSIDYVISMAGVEDLEGNPMSDTSIVFRGSTVLRVPRTVLLEEFGSVFCTACPNANAAIDSLVHEYSMDELVVLGYHTGDQMTTSETTARTAWYGAASQLPTVMIDGTARIIGASSVQAAYAAYKDSILAGLGETTPVDIRVAGSVDGSNGTVTVQLIVTDSVGVADLRLYVVVFEDSVENTVPLGDPFYRFVVRDMMPDEEGEVISIEKGDTTDIVRPFSVEDEWDGTKLGAVVFLQSSVTKEVLQAGGAFF
jgi:hypothetical protein